MATQQDKLDHEVEKIQEELKQLKRPGWRTPAGITAVVASAAFFLQYAHSKREYQLAKLERAEVTNQKIELEQKKEELQGDVDELNVRRTEAQESEARLRAEVAALTRFITDNPSLSGANALIEKLRAVNYPLTASRRFKRSDTLIASVKTTLTKDGVLKVAIVVTGLGASFKSKGYTITVKDLESGPVLKTFSTGPLTAKGETKGFFRSIDFKKLFEFNIEASVMNRIYVRDQITIDTTDA